MKALITGGAGFIGCNLADYHLKRGHRVVVYDNLSRRGARVNLRWLQANHGDRLAFAKGDVRDFGNLKNALSTDTDRVYHLAAQVAVTTSVTDPREDFETNALGTFNVLEAVRHVTPQATVFYASTNKVYGKMEGVGIAKNGARYRYRDLPLGVSEKQPLDFHSPYGCSKGCGDQYVRDYSRIYGLRTVVFRQSCIYGTRQFGVEDQGWIAHFCIAAHSGHPITIYGDGNQVRDVLWIGDLIEAYEAAAEHIDVAAGEVYNIGGGPANTVSVWGEFGQMLEGMVGRSIAVEYADWRPGDQRVYISDVRKARKHFGWTPRVSPHEGIRRLWTWIGQNAGLFD